MLRNLVKKFEDYHAMGNFEIIIKRCRVSTLVQSHKSCAKSIMGKHKTI